MYPDGIFVSNADTAVFCPALMEHGAGFLFDIIPKVRFLLFLILRLKQFSYSITDLF